MLKNNLKASWRNIILHKGFSFINITGLGIGLAFGLLISMYVAYERSYDRFHEHKDRIFRVALIWGSEQSRMQFAGAMPALAEAAQNAIPEVELAGRVQMDRDAALTWQNDTIREEKFFFADPAILRIFSFSFLEGNPERALDKPFSIVISEKQASKYFGSSRAVGMTLQYKKCLLKVSGVFKSFPAQTHLPFDFVVSYSTLAALGRKIEAPWNQWGDDLTYLLLSKNASAKSVAGKLQQLLKRNAGDWFSTQVEFVVQPLVAIHWDSASRGDIGPKGNRLYVYLFSITALLIVLVACFNFVNLTTARYLTRLREVGVRKTLGASRWQLVRQFLLESMTMAGAALAIGMLLFLLFYPVLYQFLDVRAIFSFPHFVFLAIVLGVMFALVGVLTPLYPAWILSRFHPADAVRNFHPAQRRRVSFRQPLIVLQFAISVALIFAVLVLFEQLRYFHHAHLGFDKENVVLAFLPGGDPELARKYAVLRDELLKDSGIDSVSGAFTVPGVNSRVQMGINKKVAPLEKQLSIQVLPVDYGFVRALRLKMIAGSDFSAERALDLRQGVILNETAVSILGLSHPVGEILLVPDGSVLREVPIIGVVKNFHIQSLRQKIEPCLLMIKPEAYIMVAIRTKPGASSGTLAAIKRTWQRVFGDADFTVKYLQESYDSQYRTEAVGAVLLVFFMSLVLCFSCIGLFGMASFVIGRSHKEIGIRKVFGASSRRLFWMLSLRMAGWVWISCLLAWPPAFFCCQKWLEEYAYRISLGPGIFLASGGMALLMAFAAICLEILRAVRQNPVDSLRYE